MLRVKALFLSLSVLLFLLLPVPFSARGDLGANTRLRVGKKIPDIPLLNTLTKEERRYLGLRSGGLFSFREERIFSLDDIQADYIVLEFLNRYCTSCLAQAPILCSLYQEISRDRSLHGRIKVLAVGAGNNQRETQRFQTEKKVPFPVIPDPEFEAYEALGNPGGTPYLLILRQSPEGVLLAKSYLGLIKNSDALLAELKGLVSLDLVSFQRKIQESQNLEVVPTQAFQLSWSEEEIRGKIQQAILHGDTKQRLSFQKKDWPEYQDIYLIDSLSSAGKKRWFAKVYTRPPLCDVCHPIHFLLIFNGQGVVTNFIPLHITKYDNLHITATDTQKLEKRIVGRHLTQNYQFRPEYDSVTGATMSISLIFDSLNKAGGLYRKLQQAGYIPD